MESLRLCVACRSLQPVGSLIRITFDKRQNRFGVGPNPEAPLQGRSAYVCATPACVEMALKGKKFQRALKRNIPDDIVKCLNRDLEGRKP